jgi:transcription elongation GreA/GreB family factor
LGAERRRILQDRGDAAVHHNISEENIYDGARAKEQSEEVRRIKQLKALLPR